MHCTDKYSQHAQSFKPVWLNGWVYVHKLSGCGFESRCCHLKYNWFFEGPNANTFYFVWEVNPLISKCRAEE